VIAHGLETYIRCGFSTLGGSFTVSEPEGDARAGYFSARRYLILPFGEIAILIHSISVAWNRECITSTRQFS